MSKGRAARKETAASYYRKQSDGPEPLIGVNPTKDQAFRSVAVARAISNLLQRNNRPAAGVCRTLVKDGAWTVPPIERPAGWEARADWEAIRDPW